MLVLCIFLLFCNFFLPQWGNYQDFRRMETFESLDYKQKWNNQEKKKIKTSMYSHMFYIWICTQFLCCTCIELYSDSLTMGCIAQGECGSPHSIPQSQRWLLSTPVHSLWHTANDGSVIRDPLEVHCAELCLKIRDKWNGESTVPCGAPVLQTPTSDAQPCSLTSCGLLVR